jgi:predicted RecB family nuclease
MMQNPTPLKLVISRKNSLADLAQRSITTLEQFAILPLEEIQSIDGIGIKTAPQVRALARAYLEHKAIRFSELPSAVREEGLYLDVRVDPDTHPQQPWGFSLMTPNGEKQRLLVIPGILPNRLHMDDGRIISLVPNIRSAWTQIADAADEYQCPVYYWSKNILGHITQTAPKESRHRLLTRVVDLSKLFLSVAAIPTKHDGLHDIATYLGYDTWGRDYEPYKAHIAYLVWLSDSQRIDLLKKAVNYIDSNVDGVAYLWRWLVDSQVE